MHLLKRQCQYKVYKDDKSNFVCKSILFSLNLLRPMLPSVSGFAISSDFFYKNMGHFRY